MYHDFVGTFFPSFLEQKHFEADDSNFFSIFVSGNSLFQILMLHDHLNNEHIVPLTIAVTLLDNNIIGIRNTIDKFVILR